MLRHTLIIQTVHILKFFENISRTKNQVDQTRLRHNKIASSQIDKSIAYGSNTTCHQWKIGKYINGKHYEKKRLEDSKVE